MLVFSVNLMLTIPLAICSRQHFDGTRYSKHEEFDYGTLRYILQRITANFLPVVSL